MAVARGLIGIGALLAACATAWAQETVQPGLGPENVLVVYNRDSVDSETMARYYRQLRGLAANRLCGVSVDRYSLSIPMEEFTKFRQGILEHVAKEKLEGEIRCVLLMCDIPQGVHTSNTGTSEYLALDSMLAEIRSPENAPARWNRYMAACYGPGGGGAQGFTKKMQERCGGMVLVSRIEAPGLLEMKRMLDSAQAGEAAGRAGKAFQGTFYIDTEPVNATWDAGKQQTWGAFNRLLEKCGEMGRAMGNAVVVENTTKRLEKFEGGPAVFYVGWYTLASTLNRGQNNWAPGAIAIEIHSASARLLKHALNPDSMGDSYAAFFVSQGVAGTCGAFREPYLQAFPPPDRVLGALRGGLTWAESFWCNLPQVNWQMELLGDPLYRPFPGKTQ